MTDLNETELNALRADILRAQFALRKSNSALVVIVAGVDGAGKAKVVHRLHEWLEPRKVTTNAFWDPSDETRERPHQWQFWRAFPPKGGIALFFGSWYTDPLIDRVHDDLSKTDFASKMEHINALEKMLSADGIHVLKLWFHISKDAHRESVIELEREHRKHWQMIPDDWKQHALYDRFAPIAKSALKQTSTAHAPWHVIDAEGQEEREVAAGQLVRDAMRNAARNERMGGQSVVGSVKTEGLDRVGPTLLDSVDLSRSIPDKAVYNKKLKRLQRRLSNLAWRAREAKVPTVLVFEGWDAAGKGGCIRRVTAAMDPRLYRIISTAAPNSEEFAYPYLWRFWRQIRRDGNLSIFDRSWYGRVLVERVEGYAIEPDWQRAYDEIAEFEKVLTAHGSVICKFWLHLSPEEQLRRFRAREAIQHKRHKITEDDWRNREKWGAYASAVHDMVERTSTDYALWTVVASEDKKSARIKVLKTLCKALEARLAEVE
ncbi:MAG: polyphosphate:AMP phosphotransferase [Rhodothermales bacterium]|jgi:polyphosphate:AMP phosphotransferase